MIKDLYALAVLAFTCGLVIYVLARVLERKWLRQPKHTVHYVHQYPPTRSYMIGRRWAIGLMIAGVITAGVAFGLQ